MFALTAKQPWASLILHGGKDIENRSWPPPSTLPQHGRCVDCGTRYEWYGRPTENICPFVADGTGEAGGQVVDDGPFPFRLGIHAGQSVDYEALRDLPRNHGGIAFRRGVLLGFVTVTGCHHADDNACLEVYIDGEDTYGREIERFGPCSRWAEPGQYHWTLADPEPLPVPIPMKGRQKLWRLDDDESVSGFVRPHHRHTRDGSEHVHPNGGQPHTHGPAGVRL